MNWNEYIFFELSGESKKKVNYAKKARDENGKNYSREIAALLKNPKAKAGIVPSVTPGAFRVSGVWWPADEKLPKSLRRHTSKQHDKERNMVYCVPNKRSAEGKELEKKIKDQYLMAPVEALKFSGVDTEQFAPLTEGGHGFSQRMLQAKVLFIGSRAVLAIPATEKNKESEPKGVFAKKVPASTVMKWSEQQEAKKKEEAHY